MKERGEATSMQVTIDKVECPQDEGALIRVCNMTEEIRNAVDLLEGNSYSIPVTKEGKTYLCKTKGIYYIESVDKQTYIYTKDDCFETKYRLYELEEMLGGYFARCSKALIVNLRKLQNVNSELGGRMNATMLNGEKLVIARSYVKEIKRRLEI